RISRPLPPDPNSLSRSESMRSIQLAKASSKRAPARRAQRAVAQPAVERGNVTRQPAETFAVAEQLSKQAAEWSESAIQNGAREHQREQAERRAFQARGRTSGGPPGEA